VHVSYAPVAEGMVLRSPGLLLSSNCLRYGLSFFISLWNDKQSLKTTDDVDSKDRKILNTIRTGRGQKYPP